MRRWLLVVGQYALLSLLEGLYLQHLVTFNQIVRSPSNILLIDNINDSCRSSSSLLVLTHNARFIAVHALRCRLTTILSRISPKFILSSWDLPVNLHLSLFWNWCVYLLIPLNFITHLLPQEILFVSFGDFDIIMKVINFLEDDFAVLFFSWSVIIVYVVTSCVFGLWLSLFSAVFNLLVLKGRLQFFCLWIYFLDRQLLIMTLQRAESLSCVYLIVVNWRSDDSVWLSWRDQESSVRGLRGRFLGASAEGRPFTWCWWTILLQIWVARILVNWILVGITGERRDLLHWRLVVDSREMTTVIAARGEGCLRIHWLVSEISVFSLSRSGCVIGGSFALEDANFLILIGSQGCPLRSIHSQTMGILRIKYKLLTILGLHWLLDVFWVSGASTRLSSPQKGIWCCVLV